VTLVGMTFGRLTVEEQVVSKNPNFPLIWKCRCECTKSLLVNHEDLIYGRQVSCGCGEHIK